MITHNNIFDKFITFQALYDAYLKARKGKRMRRSCLEFEQNLEGNLIQLQNELVWGEYKTGGYRSFAVHEPKTRTITALVSFRDRVVHHALMNEINPIFEKSFISDSYACIVGKGTHAGANAAQRMMRACLSTHGKIYALKADVRRYFASVDHCVLKRLLRKKISCKRTLTILDDIVDSYSEPMARGRGIPIGNLTSQLFANIYLNELDQLVKCRKREKWYVRYMDDFVIMSGDKDHLRWLRVDIERFLSETLTLELNNKTQIFPVSHKNGRGLDFLGYHMWPDRRRLRKDSLKRFKRRVRGLQAKYETGEVDFSDIKQQLSSWIAHARHGGASNAVKSYLDRSPFRRAHARRN